MIDTPQRQTFHLLSNLSSNLVKHSAFTFKPARFLLGIALALAGCSEGDFQSAQTVTFGEADELQIQPIRVCDDNGNSCAGINLFRDITEKILAQAKLRVSFLPERQLNASRFLSINDSSDRNSSDYEFYELTRTGGQGAFGRNPDSTETSGPINVWFVDTIEGSNGFTQFGLAWVNANGVLISKEALEFNGTGRPDTLAHEVGHNLGLRHSTLGAGGSNNLLTDGDRRNVPGSVDDIAPDGAGLSSLTTAQLQTILDSPFVNSGTSGSLSSSVVASGDVISALPYLQASRTEAEATATSAVSVPDEASSWIGLSMLGVFIVKTSRKKLAIAHD